MLIGPFVLTPVVQGANNENGRVIFPKVYLLNLNATGLLLLADIICHVAVERVARFNQKYMMRFSQDFNRSIKREIAAV